MEVGGEQYITFPETRSDGGNKNNNQHTLTEEQFAIFLDKFSDEERLALCGHDNNRLRDRKIDPDHILKPKEAQKLVQEYGLEVALKFYDSYISRRIYTDNLEKPIQVDGVVETYFVDNVTKLLAAGGYQIQPIGGQTSATKEAFATRDPQKTMGVKAKSPDGAYPVEPDGKRTNLRSHEATIMTLNGRKILVIGAGVRVEQALNFTRHKLGKSGVTLLGSNISTASSANGTATLSTGGQGPDRMSIAAGTLSATVTNGFKTKEITGQEINGHTGILGRGGMITEMTLEIPKMGEEDTFSLLIPVKDEGIDEQFAQTAGNLIALMQPGLQWRITERDGQQPLITSGWTNEEGEGIVLTGADLLWKDDLEKAIRSGKMNADPKAKKLAEQYVTALEQDKARYGMLITGQGNRYGDNPLIQLIESEKVSSMSVLDDAGTAIKVREYPPTIAREMGSEKKEGKVSGTISTDWNLYCRVAKGEEVDIASATADMIRPYLTYISKIKQYTQPINNDSVNITWGIYGHLNSGQISYIDSNSPLDNGRGGLDIHVRVAVEVKQQSGETREAAEVRRDAILKPIEQFKTELGAELRALIASTFSAGEKTVFTVNPEDLSPEDLESKLEALAFGEPTFHGNLPKAWKKAYEDFKRRKQQALEN